MLLTKHDLAHKLNDNDDRPRRHEYKRHGQYTAIRNHPGRVVPTNTAYQRWRRTPGLSIDEACETPFMKNDGHKFFSHRYDAEYLSDLKSDKTKAEIARKWGISYTTVFRHQREEMKK